MSVVILTGAGEKAFAAGADISEINRKDALTGVAMAVNGQRILRRFETMGKPSIAAVNGFALGGGCEIAMACTIRIASEKAKFGQPEVNLGVIPGYAGTQRLCRIVGRGVAMELILTGRIIDAAEALRIGLVTQVVPPAELLASGGKDGEDASRQGAARDPRGDGGRQPRVTISTSTTRARSRRRCSAFCARRRT